MKNLIACICLIVIAQFSNAQSKEPAKALALYEKGEFKKALNAVNEDIEKAGFNENNACLKSEILMYVNADQCWENIQLTLRKFPTSANAYKVRGGFYYELKDFENSAKDYTKALELCNDDTLRFKILLSRSATCGHSKSIDSCIQDVENALKIRPNSIEALNNLSTSYFTKGDTKSSINILLKMKKIDSTFMGVYVNLGYQYQVMENYTEAEKYLLEGLRIKPKDPYILNNLGYTQFKLGKTEESIRNINKSLQVDPSNSYCYRNLALIYQALKDNEKVCQNVNKALGLKFTELYGEEMQKLKQKSCY